LKYYALYKIRAIAGMGGSCGLGELALLAVPRTQCSFYLSSIHLKPQKLLYLAQHSWKQIEQGNHLHVSGFSLLHFDSAWLDSRQFIFGAPRLSHGALGSLP
jgi:hypothetical protein